MNPQPQASAGDLMAQLQDKFERLCQDVTEAVNHASPGQVINDSEEQVRDLLARFRKDTYQAAVQLRLAAQEAASPPLRSTPPPANACRARALSPSPSSPSTAASACPASV